MRTKNIITHTNTVHWFMMLLLFMFVGLIKINVNAQDGDSLAQRSEFGDPSFYLIDSLNITILPESEKQLLDSNLEKYHKARTDSDRYEYIRFIIEASWNEEVWPRYNEFCFNWSGKELEKDSSNTLFLAIQAESFINKGFLANKYGDIPEALNYYDRALHLYLKLGRNIGIADALLNIASVYENQEEWDLALKNYRQSIGYYSKADESTSGLGAALNNMGSILERQNQLDSALIYYRRSLEFQQKMNFKLGIGVAYNSIGNLYQTLGTYDSSLFYFQKSLIIHRQLGDKAGSVYLLVNTGSLYLKTGKVQKAKALSEEAYVIANELHYPKLISSVANLKVAIYKMENNWKLAYKYAEIKRVMEDSIRNDANREAILRQNARFEYEKQLAIDEANYQHELELKEANYQHQIDLEHEENYRNQITIYASIAGLILVIIFSVIMTNKFRTTNAQKQIIESQRDDIVASIEYAGKIQKSILTPIHKFPSMVKEHFVWYVPKDIVSGDFYWYRIKGDYMYLAVADCTGHGVPGALLTMLGTTFLNEITSTPNALEPATILNVLREKIVNEFSMDASRPYNEEDETKDGMDISLIRIKVSGQTQSSSGAECMWAGANNPLYIVTSDEALCNQYGNSKSANDESGRTILSVQPDKQPIGYAREYVPFTNHVLQLSENTILYLFSDGFADQFGGPKGKKYGYRNFRKLLLEHNQRPLAEQHKTLKDTFRKWRSDADEQQLDDVCVIGIKI